MHSGIVHSSADVQQGSCDVGSVLIAEWREDGRALSVRGLRGICGSLVVHPTALELFRPLHLRLGLVLTYWVPRLLPGLGAAAGACRLTGVSQCMSKIGLGGCCVQD